MTDAPVKQKRYLRPAVVFPVAMALLIATVLMTPEPTPVDRTGRLTTYSASPGGARATYEILQRLGWHVIRRKQTFASPLDTNAVYVSLDPPQEVSADETHALLEAVRHGAGLMYVVQNQTPLADSLHLRHANGGYLEPSADSALCAKDETPAVMMWFDARPHLYEMASTTPWLPDTAAFFPVVVERFLESDTDSMARYRTPRAAVGFPYGRGRVMAVADADVFRNDVVRVCRWDIGRQIVRMTEWTARGGPATVVFDEYHQGYGTQPVGVMGSIGSYLETTASGRTVAQGLVAALVLLLALGIRPIVPRERRTIERRSPLEHVAALAQAYRQIGATRVAIRRLARGLRRRHAIVQWAQVETRYPEIAPDVRRVADAEQHQVTPAELLVVAESVARIDRVLAGRGTSTNINHEQQP